jgi:hypothetical protein
MGLARRDQGARKRRCRDIGDDNAMHTDIALSSLRELDAVALATNATLSMKQGTRKPKEGGTRLRIA